ncbi:hypothetical protein BDV93DRAFT_519945 [Ceratobasidium sp. AG-I]|nr:hypothetical protein BDV93DRAFT_519945 [Ceratobasidium sp. AG-I]
MFSLSYVKGTTDSPVETITLHDDPHIFARLLDAVYDGFGFSRTATLRECLEVLELAQKYEMVDLENALHSHLEQKLPVSASDPLEAYNRYHEYVSDQSLAPLVLRAGSPKLIPWAFYAFGVRLAWNFSPTDKTTYKPPHGLPAIDGSYIYPLILLPRIVSHTLTTWRSRITSFYGTSCSRAMGKHSSCSRRAFTGQDGLQLTGESPLDPVAWIAETYESSRRRGIYGGWCAQCLDSLKDKVRSTFLEIHPCLIECVAQAKGRPVSDNP